MTAPAAPASPEPAGLATKPRMQIPAADSVVWLYALIGGLAAIHVSMLFGRSINWDEFWFYSQVEILARGEFLKPLQTIHTRFFYWWLPGMPGNEIDHIQIARGFMLACLAITTVAIYLCAEAFSDKRTALLATGLYLGSGYVLQHGASFRVDPIVTACLATGLAIAVRSRLSIPAILAFGAVIGLAAMVTIKFVLWAPAFAAVALWRWQDQSWDWRYPLRWIVAGIVALVVFAALYWWHGTGTAGSDANAEAVRTLDRSAGKMFGFPGNPLFFMVIKGIAVSMPLIIAALMVPWRAFTTPTDWPSRIAMLGLWLPIVTPAFYYNSYPYFYAFILPPVAVACAFTLPVIVKRYGQFLVAGVMFASSAVIWWVDARGVTAEQRHMVDAVHRIVPEPVNYFDCCGMIGSYPKANKFQTKWGRDVYRDTGEPQLESALDTATIPLLLDNRDWYSSALEGDPDYALHPRDVTALTGTYFQYWGDVYLAGRQLPSGASMDWQVRVPGTYTVRGELLIDGKLFDDGSFVELERGFVLLSNTSAAQATLVWGKDPYQPQDTPPEDYWTLF